MFNIDTSTGDIIAYGTTLDEIFIALMVIILLLGLISGILLFRHFRK